MDSGQVRQKMVLRSCFMKNEYQSHELIMTSTLGDRDLCYSEEWA